MSFAVESLRDALRIPPSPLNLDASNFASYILPPLICYLVVAILVVLPQTRSLRVALWPVTMLLALRAAMSLDMSMERPQRKFLNIDLVVSL